MLAKLVCLIFGHHRFAEGRQMVGYDITKGKAYTYCLRCGKKSS